jgi:hypothetical protein
MPEDFGGCGPYVRRRSRSSHLRADDRSRLKADHGGMLAIALLTVEPVVLALAAATILAVTAVLTGMRMADHRRQVAAGAALTDEQVEEQVARRLGYAPRRTTA